MKEEELATLRTLAQEHRGRLDKTNAAARELGVALLEHVTRHDDMARVFAGVGSGGAMLAFWMAKRQSQRGPALQVPLVPHPGTTTFPLGAGNRLAAGERTVLVCETLETSDPVISAAVAHLQARGAQITMVVAIWGGDHAESNYGISSKITLFPNKEVK